ncbi:hypothetical protein EQK42_12020, partial [Streptomyces albidoflavus]
MRKSASASQKSQGRECLCRPGAALLHLGHAKVSAIPPAIAQAQEVVFTGHAGVVGPRRLTSAPLRAAPP